MKEEKIFFIAAIVCITIMTCFRMYFDYKNENK